MSSKNYKNNDFLLSDFRFPDERVGNLISYLKGNPLIIVACFITCYIASLFIFENNPLYSSIGYLLGTLLVFIFIAELIKYIIFSHDYMSGLALVERLLLYTCVENNIRVIVLKNRDIELIGVCERLSTRYLLISCFPLENDDRFFILSSGFWTILKANKNILLKKKDRATYKNELEQFTKFIYNPDPREISTIDQ